LEQRLKQLNPYIQEIVPHKSDLSSLEVIGYNPTRRRSQQKNDIEVYVYGKTNEESDEEITDNIQTDDDDNKENETMGDSLNNIPDVSDLPIMGKF